MTATTLPTLRAEEARLLAQIDAGDSITKRLLRGDLLRVQRKIARLCPTHTPRMP